MRSALTKTGWDRVAARRAFGVGVKYVPAFSITQKSPGIDTAGAIALAF
jgi:hypothetical protein